MRKPFEDVFVQDCSPPHTVPVDESDFLVTNKRIIFKGEKHAGISIPLNKVSAIDTDDSENNIMLVQKGGKLLR